VDMSTPLLLEVAPEIDTNPTSFYRGRGSGGGRSASRPPACGKFVRLPTLPAKKTSQLQKLDGSKYSWSPRSPKSDGTHPTAHTGWLHLCLSQPRPLTEHELNSREPVSTYRLAAWRSGYRSSSMNEVNARRARLQLGWVTVFGRVYHLGL